MAGLAILARQMGYRVTGTDEKLYPPMSTQLARVGIEWIEGYDPAHLPLEADCIIVGNTMRRGQPIIEHLLNKGLKYQSGPAFLGEACLASRWVLAVAGTHGKTTTSSMLAWILHHANLDPSFLIGGIPGNFPQSAHLGKGQYFVIEADEYDSAFFDKRSKFVHYHAKTLILNNLEYDHADIFDSLGAIQTQFHQLVRTVPSEGLIISPANDHALDEVLARGCWTPITYLGKDWRIVGTGTDAQIYHHQERLGSLPSHLSASHQQHNALSAMAAAFHVGIAPQLALQALDTFQFPKRRMELKAKIGNITLYDDFAHHPTAVRLTLAGLRQKIPSEARIIALVELGSNTMKLGIQLADLINSLSNEADKAILIGAQDYQATALPPSLSWAQKNEAIVKEVIEWIRPGDYIVVMTNKNLESLHDALIKALNLY